MKVDLRNIRFVDETEKKGFIADIFLDDLDSGVLDLDARDRTTLGVDITFKRSALLIPGVSDFVNEIVHTDMDCLPSGTTITVSNKSE